MTPRSARILAGLALAFGAFAANGARAQNAGPHIDVKPGESVEFPVTAGGGAVTLGRPRRIAPGAEPGDGEIAVAVVRHGLSPYADLIVKEKTPAPIDFVATGLIGDIKIDEIKVCGRTDTPAAGRIASGSWRISLNSFAVRADGQDCRP